MITRSANDADHLPLSRPLLRKARQGRGVCRAALRVRALPLASLGRAQVLFRYPFRSWWRRWWWRRWRRRRWGREVVRDKFPWALPHGGSGVHGCSPGCSHLPLDGDEGGGRANSGEGSRSGLCGGVSGGDPVRIAEGKPRGGPANFGEVSTFLHFRQARRG